MSTTHEHLFQVEDGNSAGTLRAWRPGDGLACSYANRASRARPCGRPVAVKETSWRGQGTNHNVRTGTTAPYRTVVCMYHVDRFAVDPGRAHTEAEKIAREKVLTDHWDEYQRIIREETDARIEAAFGDLPEELRELIRAGLQAHEPSGPDLDVTP